MSPNEYALDPKLQIEMADGIANMLFGKQPQKPARLLYSEEDVCRIAVIGSRLANFLTSSNRHTCLMCMATGADMTKPENHKPLCGVSEWWTAASELRVAGGEL